MTITLFNMILGKNKAFLTTLLCCFLTPVVLAGPLGLPDSARPGAVRPQQEGPPPEPVISAEDSIEIPAVIDRPFDIEEGPYVVVDKFRLLDAKDMPEFDVVLSEVQDILAKLRKDQPERGFSIGQLQEVTDEVTRYYREKGLILSQAVVPVQTVTEGIVDIQIFIGRLGRVLAEGNEDYSAAVLRKPFKNLIGKPVTKDTVEAALLTLTDFPGLSVFGVFQPGQKVGEADIVLKVQEEKWYDVAFRVDDHGLPETGRNRVRTVIDWNNPTGGADKLSVTYQQTYNPKNNLFWAIDYERFLGYGFTAGATLFKNSFDVGGTLAVNQIKVITRNAGLFLEKSFIRSRQQNLASKLSLTRKTSATRTAAIDTNRDALAVLALQGTYDSVDTYHPLRFLYSKLFKIDENFGGGLNFATLEVSRGFNDLFGSMGSPGDALDLRSGSQPSRRGGAPAREFAPGQFSKIYGSFSRLQLLTKNQSLLFKSEFQYSNSILTPMEQYSVGGPDNVRAFPDAQALFDRAYFFSFEYILNAPFIADRPAFANRTWGELLQVSVFYDFATGLRNNPLLNSDVLEQGDWITFRGYGMGLRFNLPGSIDSRLMWSRQLGDNTLTPANNGHRAQVWGDLTYSF